MAGAKDFQLLGAETQKATVRAKLWDALDLLLFEWLSAPENSRPVLKEKDVLVRSGVSKKTVEQEYHAIAREWLETFLLIVGIGPRKVKVEQRTGPKRQSIFAQNAVLATLADAVRYQKDQVIKEKDAEIARLKAALASTIAERDRLQALASSDRRPGRPRARRAA